MNIMPTVKQTFSHICEDEPMVRIYDRIMEDKFPHTRGDEPHPHPIIALFGFVFPIYVMMN